MRFHYILFLILPLVFLSACLVTVGETPRTTTGETATANLPDDDTGTGSASDVERRAFNLINEYRVSLGLAALVWNEKIARECRTHSRYMISRNTLSHDNFSTRIANLRRSINVGGAAENVAMNYNMPDPAKVARDGWIRSPGHHKNIKGNYTHSAMGAVRSANGHWYLTQVFLNVR